MILTCGIYIHHGLLKNIVTLLNYDLVKMNVVCDKDYASLCHVCSKM